MTNPGELTVIEKPLTKVETKRLNELETVIDKNIKAFFAVWFALKEIHDNRLYRTKGNRTFERYCEDEWEISRSYGHRYIKAADVVLNVANVDNCLHLNNDPVSTIADILGSSKPSLAFPVNECQAKALGVLPPEHQKEVWEKVCLKAEITESKITAKFISQCVKQFKLEQFGEVVKEIQRSAITPREPKKDAPKISLPLRTSFASMLEIIQHESDKSWRGTNQDVVVTWLRTLLTAAEEAR